VIERLKMSKMGNLYLEISEGLEKELKGFAEALECGCSACEDFTIPAIQREFIKYMEKHDIFAPKQEPSQVIKATKKWVHIEADGTPVIFSSDTHTIR
jgi:hypothetical protein